VSSIWFHDVSFRHFILTDKVVDMLAGHMLGDHGGSPWDVGIVLDWLRSLGV